MPQLSEQESQLPYLVTAGEIIQKLTPIRLATLSRLTGDDVKPQNQIADALGVSSTSITTHLQLLSDFPRPLTIRKRRYEITSTGDAVIEVYSSMLRRFDEDFSMDDLSEEDEREEVGEFLSPLHKTRSIPPFLVLYSISQYRSDEEKISSAPTAQLPRVLDDVKEWEGERGKSVNRKQIRRILNRFGEYDMIELAGDRITLLEKGEKHIRLLEGVRELLEEDVDGSETPSAASQQTIDDRLTRSDTGGVDGSPVPSEYGNEPQGERSKESQRQNEDITGSALPAIVPAYRVVTDDSRSQSSAPVLPLTSSTRPEDMADKFERISQQYENPRLELVWTNLSETDEAESASDSRLKP